LLDARWSSERDHCQRANTPVNLSPVRGAPWGRVAGVEGMGGPARAEGEVSDTDARLWHPWLRINRLQRVMLHTRWSAEAWAR
jgi:hypothetical protein